MGPGGVGMSGERGGKAGVGVFLCECDDVGTVVDLRTIERELEETDGALQIFRARHWCTPAGRRRFRETIEGGGLDAVVVAGCSPRILGDLMEKVAADAGVDRNRVILVNLREHCARVHTKEPSRATSKAVRLVRIGVARARLACSLAPVTTQVERSAVVIGGGVAGMTAARALAAREIPVVLIEKETQLGGLLKHVNLLYPTYCDARDYVGELAGQVTVNPSIEVLTESRVTDASGHVGSYGLTVETSGAVREISAGCVILATGADVLAPEGMFGHGSNPRVVTQLEFEGMLRRGLRGIERLVLVQCAGSRTAERPYCSRVCCTATVKNTMTVIESVPGAEITVLSRGFAQYVGDLDRARDAGVTFLRYDPERPPAVEAEAVEVDDAISSMRVSIPYDLVVLATPLVPRPDTAELARQLRAPVDDHGFVAEPHVKLRPGTFAPSGVFVAGSVHWPATVTECLSQAHSAAARAAALIERGVIERDPYIAIVDELTCRGCERCVEACAHGAPAIDEGEDGIGVSKIDEMLCVGCGVCVSACPSSAIELSHMTSGQLRAMARAAAG